VSTGSPRTGRTLVPRPEAEPFPPCQAEPGLFLASGFTLPPPGWGGPGRGGRGCSVGGESAPSPCPPPTCTGRGGKTCGGPWHRYRGRMNSALRVWREPGLAAPPPLGQAGGDRPVAGQRAVRDLVPGAHPPGSGVHRSLVAGARFQDPGDDDPGGASGSRGILSRRAGAAGDSRGSRRSERRPAVEVAHVAD